MMAEAKTSKRGGEFVCRLVEALTKMKEEERRRELVSCAVEFSW